MLGEIALVLRANLAVGLARGKLHHVNDAVKVQPRTPAQYRRLTGAPALVHKHACVALEHRDRIILGDVRDIDHLQGTRRSPIGVLAVPMSIPR